MVRLIRATGKLEKKPQHQPFWCMFSKHTTNAKSVDSTFSVPLRPSSFRKVPLYDTWTLEILYGRSSNYLSMDRRTTKDLLDDFALGSPLGQLVFQRIIFLALGHQKSLRRQVRRWSTPAFRQVIQPAGGGNVSSCPFDLCW